MDRKSVIRILHVDDDEVDQSIVARLIARHEPLNLTIALTQVSTAHEAHGLLRAKTFDIVLIDAILPRTFGTIGGLDIVEALRARVGETGGSMPALVVLSGLPQILLENLSEAHPDIAFAHKQDMDGSLLAALITSARQGEPLTGLLTAADTAVA